MKHEKLLISLASTLLAFITAWGAVGCFVSAFDLQLTFSALPALVCGIAALAASVLLSFRHGGILLLCLLALAGGYLYRDGTTVRQLWQLVHHLTIIYDRAYGLGVLQLPEDLPVLTFADLPLCIWGALTAMAVARSVCRQKSVWLPVLTVLLPLCACIVVTDTVPGEFWLMTVMTGLILLLLTSSVRLENAFQGLWLTAAAAPAVILALIGLFLAVPQDSYVNQSEVLRENILIAVRNFPRLLDTGMTQLASKLQSEPPETVNLAELGTRVPFTYPVMTVTAEQSGTLYLREQDYDIYDGLGWRASENREEVFSLESGTPHTITIHTNNRKDFYFLPYYPGAGTHLTGGLAGNPHSETEYTITRHDLPENWRLTAYQSAGVSEIHTDYLALPEITRHGATELLQNLYTGNPSNTEKADLIAALVINSADYDLDPGKMPESETDFALWFLRSNDKGYCIHFATAATVLLRAADVPARYVTGYMLEAQAGEPVTVTEENAHAWAEYYEPNLGLWIPLEVTPASETPVEIRPNRPAATHPTVPSEATESSATEETEAVTQPSVEPTVPTQTVLPEIPAAPPAKRLRLPLWILLFPGLMLLLAGQRSLRLSLRRRQQRTGDRNQQALCRWREAVLLTRLLQESPTEELIVLAQKAKFSQHQLTQEELLQFDSHNRTCLRRLREKPWYLQLIYRYIFAAY